MPRKRAFLAALPGDPLCGYLSATLDLAPAWPAASALVLPRLTGETVPALLRALLARKPAFLCAESLPRPLSADLAQGLSALGKQGLAVCPLTSIPAWVRSGAVVPKLLTLDRLNALAAQGFDRLYLTGRPAATPLARQAAKAQTIHLTGGIYPGTCQSHRLGVVYPEKQRPHGQ